MGAALFGIGAAVCWGLADYLGGTRTRALTLAAVLLVSQLTGAAAIAIVVLASGTEPPAFSDITPAIVGGAFQLLGIAALYRGLAIGTMSVISPISASAAAVIPLTFALATGEHPAAIQLAGMGAAFAGVILATRSPEETAEGSSKRDALVMAGLAAIGFGGFYIGIGAAVDHADPLWSLLAARTTAAIVLLTVLAVMRPRISAPRGVIPALALIGLLDVSANVCFTLGANTGLLSVVSVLSSLYPVATVLLARAWLGERLVPLQAWGVAVALGGVAMIAAG